MQAVKMRPTPTQAAGRAVAWSGCSGGTHRILHRANKAARGAFLAQRAMKTLIKVKINQATFKLTPLRVGVLFSFGNMRTLGMSELIAIVECAFEATAELCAQGPELISVEGWKKEKEAMRVISKANFLHACRWNCHKHTAAR